MFDLRLGKWRDKTISPACRHIKINVRYNKKRLKNICLVSLKKGKKWKKKIQLITDGGVKAFIGKALTGRLNEESFTYYYNMFRSTLISPSLLLRYITRHSWSLLLFVFRFLSNFRFRRMGDCKWLIGFDAYCSRDI